jgi:hypothetical protein
VACDVSQRWWAPRDWYGAVHIGTGPERMGGAIASRAVVVASCRTVRAACGAQVSRCMIHDWSVAGRLSGRRDGDGGVELARLFTRDSGTC